MGKGSEPRPSRAQRRLGRLIKQGRLQAGLSQVAFAQRVQRDQTTVSRWESGKVEMTLGQIRLAEDALGLSPGTLVADVGYVAPSTTGIPFVSTIVSTAAEAADLLLAAATLGIGVRVRNVYQARDLFTTLVWVVDLLTDPPDEADD